VDALKQIGLEAFGASTSNEALALANQLHPEVAVLDLGLPEMDGFDLARALRSRPHATPLRLIALTGYSREQDMLAAREAGFDAFFSKPVEIPTLLGELRLPLN
jgi:CheY-like chemotaxis protein